MPKSCFIPQPFEVYCDTYNCRNQAKYQLGNPDGPKHLLIQICDECLDDMMLSAQRMGLIKEIQEPDKKDLDMDNEFTEDGDFKESLNCKYCGKEFEKPGSLKMHTINCPQRPRS